VRSIANMGIFPRPPLVYLIFGCIFLSAAVIFTFTGKALGRYGSWVCRAKDPSGFWLLVALYYLGGVFFIGCFLVN